MKIFEARQLPGGSIHPVVRVSAADQDKDSKIKKCTNNPSFNEVTFTFLQVLFYRCEYAFSSFPLQSFIYTWEMETRKYKKRSNFP